MTVENRNKVGNAPNGDKTTLAGTEKFPIDGSYYTTPLEIQTYTRDLDNSYVVRGGFASSSPADATTYYFGCFPHVALQSTAAINPMYFLRAGTIVAADVFFSVTGVLGTSTVSTLSLRLNNTTDTTLTAAVALNAITYHVQNTSLSVAVAVTDYVELKWLTPTWATNPTNVLCAVTLFVK